jgi:hypothetical protein
LSDSQDGKKERKELVHGELSIVLLSTSLMASNSSVDASATVFFLTYELATHGAIKTNVSDWMSGVRPTYDFG